MSNYSHSHDYETSPNPSKNCPNCNLQCRMSRHHPTKGGWSRAAYEGAPPQRRPPEQDAFTTRSPLPCLWNYLPSLSFFMEKGQQENQAEAQKWNVSVVQYFNFWHSPLSVSWSFGILRAFFVQLFQLYLEQSSIQRRFRAMNHGCIACCLVGNHSHIICSVTGITLRCSSLLILLVTGGVNGAEQYNDELKQSQPLVKSRKRRKTFWQRGCQTVSLDAVSKTLCDALSSPETLYVVAAAQDKWLKFIVTLIHERIYYTGTGTRYRQHVQTFK